MSDIEIGGSGNFDGFEDLLKIFSDVSKRLPSGVRFKRERNKYLNFQITMPDGRRKVKPSGCALTDVGIYQALDKAWKIKNALSTITSETELWEWYDREILGINEITNDLYTSFLALLPYYLSLTIPYHLLLVITTYHPLQPCSSTCSSFANTIYPIPDT